MNPQPESSNPVLRFVAEVRVLISHSRKFAFIHIYRTGGTSVVSSLARYSRWRDQLVDRFYSSGGVINIIAGTLGLHDDGYRWFKGIHKHATAMQVRDYLGPQVFSRYNSFAVVRNPWDWQVSIYEYIKRAREHQKHTLANTLSFPEFLEQEISKGTARLLDFLTDERGDVLVKRIGRFENLRESMREVTREIGVSEFSLPHLNAAHRDRDYRAYYDDKSAGLVATYFRNDIEHFRYTF